MPLIDIAEHWIKRKQKKRNIRLPLHPSYKVRPKEKHIEPQYDDYRLNAFTTSEDGIWHFDGVGIAEATARTIIVPRLVNDVGIIDDNTQAYDQTDLMDLTSFIIGIQKAFRYCTGEIFHYTILYLLRGLAKANLEASSFKLPFTPARGWTSQDTYYAAFLLVASRYHNPERAQQPPTWHNFYRITGLDVVQQYQYLQHMEEEMKKTEFKDLDQGMITMVRHGWMQELPDRVGRAWYEASEYTGKDTLKILASKRQAYPTQPLQQINTTDETIEKAMHEGALPDIMRSYTGDSEKMGYRGPIKVVYEPPVVSQASSYEDDAYGDLFRDTYLRELVGQSLPIRRRRRSRILDDNGGFTSVL